MFILVCYCTFALLKNSIMTTSDFGKDLELVELMANNILAMEDKYEASMRGGFLKRLMNE